MATMPTLPPELTLPPRTLCHRGSAALLPAEAAVFGRRGFLVHGKSLVVSGQLPPLLASLRAGLAVTTWQHPGGEPTLDHVDAALAAARQSPVDWVAGIGGGSVLDLARTVAGLLGAPLTPLAFHDGAPIPPSHVPFLAIPTTAGTGSEATTVCVLTNAATGVKKSIRHPTFMARAVMLDADLLGPCPPAVIAASGMDALTQAIESFTSLGATRLTDLLALEAARSIAASLEPAWRNPHSPHADALLLGSYLAGVALANARLGVVHGLAHPLGARYHVPHGLACAACLPHALEFNRPALGDKYAQLGGAVGEDPLTFVRRLLRRLGLASPFAGRPLPDRARVIEETLASGSTRSNPRPVGPAEAHALLSAIFSADAP